MIKRLMEEFGYLAEDDDGKNIEDSVRAQLGQASKLDSVDTVAFGLETDDGQIVKVYVADKDGEKFEKLMSELLGKVDDIEEAINQVSTEVDIIDVVWPDDEDETDDETETDQPDEEQDVKNSKVRNPKEVVESYGESKTRQLLEKSNHTISEMLQTANQHLVYEAITHLGVPDLALDRSPYKMQILKAIRETAQEVSQNTAMKNALKVFVKQQIIDDKVPTEVKESLNTPQELYWDIMVRLIGAVDTTPAKTLTSDLQQSSLWATVQRNSMSSIRQKIPSDLMNYMRRLITAFDNADKTDKTNVQETLSNVEFMDFLTKMINLTGTAEQLIASQIWRRVMYAAKTQYNRLPGNVKLAIDQMNSKLMVVEAKEKPIDETPAGEAESTFEYESEGDSLHFKSTKFDINLSGESLERAIKGVEGHKTFTVKTDEGKFVTFSPRGSAVQVKFAATDIKELMSGPDVDAFIEAAKGVLEDEPVEAPPEEAEAPVDEPMEPLDKKKGKTDEMSFS